MKSAVTLTVKAMVGAIILSADFALISGNINELIIAPQRIQRKVLGRVYTDITDLQGNFASFTFDGRGHEGWVFGISDKVSRQFDVLCAGMSLKPKVSEPANKPTIRSTPDGCLFTLPAAPPIDGRTQPALAISYSKAVDTLEVSESW